MKQIRILSIMAMALWASALSAQSHWQCNINDFTYDMAVYFQIADGELTIDDVSPYEIAAFVGDECRGVAEFKEQVVEETTVRYGYLRIRSNSAQGESMRLKVYNKNTQEEKRIFGIQITFSDGERMGFPSSPVTFNITAAAPKYQVTVAAQDPVMGSTTGSGTYEEGEIAHLSATANTGYHFVKWSDDDVETEREITVMSAVALQAIFAPDQHQLTFISEGNIVRSELQDFASTILPPQNPVKEGHTFTGWSPAIPETMPAEDLTFTAQFSVNQYTMTFVLNNGEENVVKTQDYGTELTAPNELTKTGYTFSGWVPEVPATIPAENRTFTAQWTVNSYKATFVVDGQETVKDVTYDTAIEIPADPVKEGHTFTGWSPAIPETMPAENLTFTAQFSVNQYTVTFVFNNGEENVVKTQDYGTELTAPNELTKTGYTFSGWVPEVPATIPAENRTFTAQWTVNSYKATFVVDGQETVKDVTYDTAIEIPADPVKEGHTFTGWSPAIPESMPAEDLTFTAQFSVNQYTMTFVLNNGEENVVKTQDYGTELTAPNEPTKTGYTFSGWAPEVPATIPAENRTFTAQWTVNSYKATFVVDGQETVKDVTYDTAIEIPANPVKEGHTFTGWSPAIPETMPAEDLTFTAQFSVNQYTVTFVFNNGEENVVKTQDYGTELTAPNEPTKTGYTFSGWVPEVPATIPAENRTFTAQWTVNSYKATFVVDGQETVKDVTYDTAIEIPADPVKEGHTFTGWSPAIPETMPAEDLTFTAQFSVNQYTVTFVADGKTIRSELQDYGTIILAPEVPEKEGHTFAGWNPTLAEGTTVPAADITFEAVYTVNKYYVIYIVNGKEWARDEIEYGATIVLRDYTAEEGYTFNGWECDEDYETMPAHDVTYTASITSGIAQLLAGGKYADVYTINGTLVGRRMTLQQVQTLPSGLYLVNGRKALVK